MKRQVFWSKTALEDLKTQIAYIAADSPTAARHVARPHDLAAGRLGNRSTGRPGRVEGTWEKSVQRLPYIIAYALDDNDDRRLIILRIIHTARKWSEGTWPKCPSSPSQLVDLRNFRAIPLVDQMRALADIRQRSGPEQRDALPALAAHAVIGDA